MEEEQIISTDSGKETLITNTAGLNRSLETSSDVHLSLSRSSTPSISGAPRRTNPPQSDPLKTPTVRELEEEGALISGEEVAISDLSHAQQDYLSDEAKVKKQQEYGEEATDLKTSRKSNKISIKDLLSSSSSSNNSNNPKIKSPLLTPEIPLNTLISRDVSIHSHDDTPHTPSTPKRPPLKQTSSSCSTATVHDLQQEGALLDDAYINPDQADVYQRALKMAEDGVVVNVNLEDSDKE